MIPENMWNNLNASAVKYDERKVIKSHIWTAIPTALDASEGQNSEKEAKNQKSESHDLILHSWH